MEGDFGGKSYPADPPPTADDKTMAMVSHILFILLCSIGPVIIWAIKKDTSPFLKKQCMQSVMFGLGTLILDIIVAILAMVTCGIGAFLTVVPFGVRIFYSVIGIMKNNQGLVYEFPVTGGWVK